MPFGVLLQYLQAEMTKESVDKGYFQSLRIYLPTQCVFDDDLAKSEDQMWCLKIHYDCDLSK